jgi:iron complex outermembrane recepter protein
MYKHPPGRLARVFFRATFGCVAGVLALGAPPALIAQQGAIDEVIVTGTFIRRKDGFDTASPVDVIDAVDISERGTPNIGEIIRNTTYNYGVASVTNILAATGQGGASPNANLRGLGSGATLTLMDGRRSTSQNLSVMYPQIAVQRIETLTDGGAAIYGTDAIGGVVNLIPRRSFEGLEIRSSHNATTDGPWEETTWSVIGGADSGRTSVVGSFEYRDRKTMQFMDRPEYALGAASYTNTAFPGQFQVPTRNAAGDIIGAAATVDPGCGVNNPASADRKHIVGGYPQGKRLGANCFMEFGANFNFMSPSESWIGAFFADHEFTENLSFSAEVVFARQVVRDRGSPQNPGGRVSELPTIPGENPGNPFRAMSAAGGALPARPLFAVPVRDSLGNVVLDAWGRPIAARDPTTNRVILAPDRFASLEQDPVNGGIAFNEDVRATNWRPLGFPQQSRAARSNSDGSGRGDADFRSNKYRWVGQLDFKVPNTSWSGWANYTYDQVGVDSPLRQESLSKLSAGLTGDLRVANRDGGGGSRPAWYNPFSTQNFTCVNRVCTPTVAGAGQVQADPLVYNPGEVLDQIFLADKAVTTTTYNIVDVVTAGDLFDLPMGTVSAAVGGQWRGTQLQTDPTFTSRAQDSFIGVGARAETYRRSTYALFGEVRVPLFDNQSLGSMELNGAVRQEWVKDIAEADLDSTNYKVAARWQPRDWVAVRASWGTAFITPSLPELFAPFTVGLSNFTDPFKGTTAFYGRGLGGTPTLEAETADVYNVGFSLDLLDGSLSYSFDYKYFDFVDRIIRLLPADIMTAERLRYQDAGFTLLNNAHLAQWLASGQANPNIVRDPITLDLVRVDTPLINASSIKWRGFDTRVSYRFDGRDLPLVNRDIGMFRVGVEATYVQEYSYIRGLGQGRIEGVGKRNNATGFAPPSPRWQSNLRLGWDMGIHSVVVFGRYHHGIRNDGEPFAGAAQVVLDLMEVTNKHRPRLPSHTEWDVQYSINLDGLWGDRRTNLQLGLLNAFNKEAPALRTLGGLETFLYDPRRRVWYVRASQEI